MHAVPAYPTFGWLSGGMLQPQGSSAGEERGYIRGTNDKSSFNFIYIQIGRNFTE